MSQLSSLGVFCGSSPGGNAGFAEAAQRLGTELANREIRLIYGGGAVGLMGIIADAVQANGGVVTGVIPKNLFSREVAHRGLDELHEVDDMHTRKALMYELSDAIVAMPGGLGTLDELAEVMTWNQIGIHRKPVGLLDVDGYFEHLLHFFERAADDRLLRPEHIEHLVVTADADQLLDRLAEPLPAQPEKWQD